MDADQAQQNLDAAAIEIRRIDRDADVRSEIWKAARWGSVALFVYLSIDSLAGKTTLALFFVQLFSATEQGVSKWWIPAALLMGLWAVGEHVLRLRKVKSMSKRIEQLEIMIDSGRTSSGLTRSGETPEFGERRGD